MIQLNGTPATEMRDTLRTKWLNKEITLPQIEDRLSKMDVPEWLNGQILEMVQYRMCDRCTCPVEQAMAGSVYYKIVDKLMKEEKNQ